MICSIVIRNITYISTLQILIDNKQHKNVFILMSLREKKKKALFGTTASSGNLPLFNSNCLNH